MVFTAACAFRALLPIADDPPFADAMWHLLLNIRILHMKNTKSLSAAPPRGSVVFLAAHQFPHVEEGIFLPLVLHHCVIGVAVPHMWA